LSLDLTFFTAAADDVNQTTGYFGWQRRGRKISGEGYCLSLCTAQTSGMPGGGVAVTKQRAGGGGNRAPTAANGFIKPGQAAGYGVARAKAERKWVQKARRESEEQYPGLVEYTNDVICEFDAMGRITYVSPVVAEIGRCSPSDIVARPFVDFVHPDDLSSIVQCVRKGLAGEPEAGEYRLLPPSGEVRWVRSFICPIIEDDRVVGFRGVLTDITERKRAEEALRESEERYRNLVETAYDVIYTVSTEGVLLSLNSAFDTITGWSRAEWLGKPFAGIIHPDDLPVAVERFRRLLQGEVPPVTDIRILTSSGEYLTGEFAGKPLTLDGEVVGSFGIVRDVTKRKRAEKALRESEKKYRDLVESINEVIYKLDAGGRITYISPVVEEASGYSPSEIVGRPVVDFIYPDDLPSVVENFQKALEGEPEPGECRVLLPSGEIRWVRSLDCPIIEGDRIVGFRGVLTDITGRKRMEEAVRESEKKYRDLVENINEVIFELDARGQITYISPVVEEASGYSPLEIVGRPFVDFVYPDDLPFLVEHVQKCLAGEPQPGEYRLVLPSGEMRWVRSFSRPFYEGDRIVGIRGALTDITGRKQMEEALRESEKKYRDLVENINEVIYEADTGGRITYVSPVLEKVSGYSPSEAVGRLFVEFIHPDDLPSVVQCVQKCLAGEPEPSEYRLLSPSGEMRWVRSFSRPVYEGDRVVGIRGALMDITKRKQMEEALQAAREQLETKVERQMLHRNPYGLTFREMTVLNLVAVGRSDKEIASELGISPLTAQKHMSNILAKMGATSRTEAGVRAVRERLLD
jgi:PAS domain S-box-containing protein